MPQLGPLEDFLKNLDSQDIGYENVVVKPDELRASQQEFNLDKVRSMMNEPKNYKSGIIISNDNYVLDGHHRWIACYNKGHNVKAVKVDLPILELMRTAKSMENIEYRNVTESVKSVVKYSLARRKYK